MDRKERRMALCVNRHRMPMAVDGAIFPKKLNLVDTERMDRTAHAAVRRLRDEGCSLVLYVSGAQYPLVAVIKECVRQDVELTLMHYNPVHRRYYPQEVVRRKG